MLSAGPVRCSMTSGSATARTTRPCGRARPRIAPGRRADGQSRLRHGRPDHRALARAQAPPRVHARAGDPRPGADAARRSCRHAARRAHHERRLVSLAFALRMAWRETRGAWRHFTVLFGCVALGVAALVSVGTLAANLDRTLAREARTLTGGDLELRSARPLDPAERAALVELEGAGAVTTAVREVAGMVRDPTRGSTLLVELRAVEREYPLYGRVQTMPQAPLDALLADHGGAGGAVVEARVLERLGLSVGDPLVVGTAGFTVAGVLVREPDRPTGLVTLGPRVLIAGPALERTGLLQVGSRVRYRTLVRLPAGVTTRAAGVALARALGDPAVRVAAFDEAQPGLRRSSRSSPPISALSGSRACWLAASGSRPR